MRKYRFYHAGNIIPGETYLLDDANSYQIIKVLKLKLAQEIWLFNNAPYEFKALVQTLNKKVVTVKVIEQVPNNVESPCKIHLVQAIAKGTKMDYIIQKAVELGVYDIIPLISERTIVNIPPAKVATRMEHWQKIIIHACSQSGRSIVPTIYSPITFREWIVKTNHSVNIILAPTSIVPITKVPLLDDVSLLIGPEGGFSEDEITVAKQHHCIEASLGPRILRTETASILAIASLQIQFGDLK